MQPTKLRPPVAIAQPLLEHNIEKICVPFYVDMYTVIGGVANLRNVNYNNDIRYTVRVHRLILGLIGVWPILEKQQHKKRLLKALQKIVCFFLLLFNLIPWALYTFLILDTFKSRIKMFGGLCFYCMAPTLYCMLMLQEDRIGDCVRHMEEDWKNVRDGNERRIMLGRAKSGRFLLICTTLFLLTSGLSYRLIQPIFRSKIVVNGNVTIRPLMQGNYYIFFDPQKSPANEILFSINMLTGVIIHFVTASVCGVTALFTMHACGQLEMLCDWLQNLAMERRSKRYAAQNLAMIIARHVRVRQFLHQIQDIVGNMCLIEVIGCTLLICVVGYYVITGWERNDLLSTLIYAIVLVSFTFNIFIVCFIGESLNSEGSKVTTTCCTIDWYCLSNREARYLILVIAMASYPSKLTAGKVIDLSFISFGAIARTAMAYLNLLRTVTM